MKHSNNSAAETPLLYRIAPLAGILVVSVVYISLFADKGAPISEGWYTEYAWRINQGQVPYRDFALAFPPLYAYLIAGFTAMFGYQLIYLRILGAILFCVRVVLLYFLLRTLFSRIASFVAAATMPFVLFSPVISLVQYDYTCFADVALFSAMLCAIKSVRSILESDHPTGARAYVLIGIAGILAGIAVQIKQSVGLIMAFFIPIAFLGVLLCSKRARLIPKVIGSYLIGAAIPLCMLFIFLAANGIIDQFVQNCLVGAVAGKGGLVAELTGWIIDPIYDHFYALIPISMLFLAVLALKNMADADDADDRALGNRWQLIFEIALCVLLLAAIAFFSTHTFSARLLSDFFFRDSNVINSVFFLVPTVLFVLYVAKAIAGAVQDKRSGTGIVETRSMVVVMLTGAAFSIAFGVGLSGGFSTDQLAIGAGICIALPVHYAVKTKLAKPGLTLVAIGVLVLCCLCISAKCTIIYSWWNLYDGTIWDQTHEVEDSDLFAGLHMREQDANCYEGVAEIADEYCQPGDEVFVFPHCPILYDVAGYHSSTYTVVQWFDVSSAPNLEADTSKILAERPAMLILCDIPRNTVKAHEASFGSRWTGKMQRTLHTIAARDYVEADSFDLGGGYVVHCYVEKSRAPELIEGEAA